MNNIYPLFVLEYIDPYLIKYLNDEPSAQYKILLTSTPSIIDVSNYIHYTLGLYRISDN